jgi:hypothetical protein
MKIWRKFGIDDRLLWISTRLNRLRIRAKLEAYANDETSQQTRARF